MKLANFKIKSLPKALPLRKIIGPSFVILGIGLGSGEVVLWPYLASNYGMGILWGAIVGLTFQFIINMEIERYALARGESVFVGLTRKIKSLPIWFYISTFLPWMWPGLAATSAAIYGHVFGLPDALTKYLAIGLLVSMGLFLSLSPIIYKAVEKLQKILIIIGVPSIFIISILLAGKSDYTALTRGLVGVGGGYFLLPAGISMASFLAALAYAGAGGNLNLAQAFYVKEKGFGMGKHSGKINSLFTGKKYTSKKPFLTGNKFKITKESVKEFNKWWRNVNIEHFLVFWLTGSVTIALLTLLAYTTTYGMGLKNDISFVLIEAEMIGKQLFPFLGILFLLITGTILFGTQLTIFDATSRILSENFVLASRGLVHPKQIPKVYYISLWALIAAGIAIFMAGFTQPLQLIFIAAVLNAAAMVVHVGLTLWLNKTSLPKEIAPNKKRTTAMVLAFLFYGGFSAYVLVMEINKIISK